MRAVFYLVVVIICSSQTTSAIVESEYSEIYLKRTILVEERTAIWCPSCAEIDPQLEQVADSHGSRIAIVGLHVNDEFENEASLKRVEYQELTDNQTYGTPTFFVDGVKTAEGYDAWQDVQKRILTQENKRMNPNSIEYDLSNSLFELPAPESGQLTIMILQHDKAVPEDADNPGEDTRDRVLIGMKIITSSNNTSSYGDLSLPETWSIVLIHEPTEGGEPYGVVEISNRFIKEIADENILFIIGTCILLGALITFYPSSVHNSEEE